MSETFSRVKKTIIAVIGAVEGEVAEDVKLHELGIDSLDIIELGLALEDEFSLMILDDYLLYSETVGDLVEAVDKSRAGQKQTFCGGGFTGA